jgi:Deacetylase PdaC
MRTPIVIAALLAGPALAAPAVIPASDLLINATTPHIDWRWRMAPEAATQPALFAAMRKAALADAAKARSAAAADAAEAAKAGYPFRRYDSISDWSLAADTPRLLALAGESYAYTGGAHGNTSHAPKIWDKTARRSIAFAALFSDWAKARALLEPAYCAALAREQTARGGNPMNNCPKLAEQPVVPFAGLGRQAKQFRVLLAPYVAGSHAEGSYLITLPWPDGIRPLVKPVYRDDLFGPAQ